MTSDFPSVRVSYKIQPTHQRASTLVRKRLSGLCVVYSRVEDRMRAILVSVAASLNTLPTRRLVANSDEFRCAPLLKQESSL